MSDFTLNDSPFTYSSSGAPSGNDPLEYSGSISFPASLLEFSGHIGDFLSNDGTNLVWSSNSVVWGTESGKQPLVIGATGDDIDSQSNLYYDTTDKYLHIEDSSGTPGIVFSNDDGTTDHASITLDSSTNGLNISALDDTDITISSKRVLTGTYSTSAFWSIRDTNTPVYTYSFAIFEPDTTNINFAVLPAGGVSIPQLGDDDTEDHIVAIDDATGILTKRSIASIDHGEIAGLSGDDHSQYTLLDGRSGDILKIDTITEYTTDAGITIEGLNIENNDISFTGTSTITDNSGSPAGLQYNADYSGNYTARSLVDKGYVDGAMASGITWLTGVIDIINFTTNEPAAPDDGDRYINTATGDSSETTQAMVANRIYEWDSVGSTWNETTPSEGDTLNVEENSITPTNDVGWHTFDGSDWIFIGSVIAHNDTSSIQGGAVDEYYHLTSAQYTNVGNLDSMAYESTSTTILDSRYYTETELDGGQLDNRYYTETEINNYSLSGDLGGTLASPTVVNDSHTHDTRYYTETELDAGQLDTRYYTETELDGGQLDDRYYIELEVDNLLDAKVSIAGDTMTGTLECRAILPTSNNSYDLGTSVNRWQDFYTYDGYFGGRVYIDDGAVGALPLCFSTDTNSGIYESAADTWHLVAGGNSIVEIETGGINVSGDITATGDIIAYYVAS